MRSMISTALKGVSEPRGPTTCILKVISVALHPPVSRLLGAGGSPLFRFTLVVCLWFVRCLSLKGLLWISSADNYRSCLCTDASKESAPEIVNLEGRSGRFPPQKNTGKGRGRGPPPPIPRGVWGGNPPPPGVL